MAHQHTREKLKWSAEMAPNYPRLTVTADEMMQGKMCSCPACTRDGPHEPDCGVHRKTPGPCNCDREDQAKAAG
jgi:hypothetical protein